MLSCLCMPAELSRLFDTKSIKVAAQSWEGAGTSYGRHMVHAFALRTSTNVYSMHPPDDVTMPETRLADVIEHLNEPVKTK